MNQRYNNRPYNSIRPITVTYDVFPHADGSVLFEAGQTKVLVAVTLQRGVPQFLRGKKVGWLTAEYALLPTATRPRHVRDVRNGRSVEISRLIGRSLRSVVTLDGLGERTVTIDCDVVNADGGTRVASLNGAFLALQAAEQKWLDKKIITEPIIREELMALAIGITSDGALLDIDYAEDVSVLADFTLVITRALSIIEIQGTAEHGPIPWEAYERIRELAQVGAAQLAAIFDNYRSASQPLISLSAMAPMAVGNGSTKRRLDESP